MWEVFVGHNLELPAGEQHGMDIWPTSAGAWRWIGSFERLADAAVLASLLMHGCEARSIHIRQVRP